MIIKALLGKLPSEIQKKIYNNILFTLGKCSIHSLREETKDIFVFSSRRGGSTLLGQMISANKGMRNIDQPLTVCSPPGVVGDIREEFLRKAIPVKPFFQFVSISENDEEQLLYYIRQLTEGKVSLNAWLEMKASKKKKFFFTDRTMLKITDANALIDWFVKSFNSHVVYLIRHPIPNALSVKKNNWGITASAYIEDPEFSEKYLTKHQEKIATDIMKSNDYFMQCILNWCLENLVPLRFAKTKFLKINYEELVLFPVQTVDLLSRELFLSDKSNMIDVAGKPSYSTSLSETNTVDKINRALDIDKKYHQILSRWKQEVDPILEKKAMSLVEVFGIDIYKYGSVLPDKKYLKFSGLLAKDML